MNKYPRISISVVALFALSLAGCATKAAVPVSSPAKAPGKATKERIVVTKVPVLVKETSSYSDGLVDEYIVYKLDGAKKAVVEKDKFDASRTDPIERMVLEYKDGRESAETVYEADGKLRSRRELGYDAAGLLLMERQLDAQGKALSASAYRYDDKGRKTEWRVLDGSGAVKAVSSYSYGKDGQSGVEMQDSGGAVTGGIRLDYADGKLAKRSYFGADKALQKYEAYAYAGGRISSVETRRADGSLVAKVAYEYGKLGELVKATNYSAAGSVSGYTTYEYVVREDSATEIYSD